MHGRLERADRGEGKGDRLSRERQEVFAFGKRARPDLLSYRIYLHRLCVFRRKIDYGRIGRESQKGSSSFTRGRKNRAGL